MGIYYSLYMGLRQMSQRVWCYWQTGSNLKETPDVFRFFAPNPRGRGLCSLFRHGVDGFGMLVSANGIFHKKKKKAEMLGYTTKTYSLVKALDLFFSCAVRRTLFSSRRSREVSQSSSVTRGGYTEIQIRKF